MPESQMGIVEIDPVLAFRPADLDTGKVFVVVEEPVKAIIQWISEIHIDIGYAAYDIDIVRQHGGSCHSQCGVVGKKHAG